MRSIAKDENSAFQAVTWGLLLHAATTLLMAGLIWCIQLVHYPLFSDALDHMKPEGFIAYMDTHRRLITPVVMLLMLAEALAALWLLRDKCLPKNWLYSGGVLLLIIWLSTALLQVPIHQLLAETSLSKQEKGMQIEKLVNTNWIRTIAWSVRGGISLWLLRPVIR